MPLRRKFNLLLSPVDKTKHTMSVEPFLSFTGEMPLPQCVTRRFSLLVADGVPHTDPELLPMASTCSLKLSARALVPAILSSVMPTMSRSLEHHCTASPGKQRSRTFSLSPVLGVAMPRQSTVDCR
jgi:hypothetical protein